MIITILGLPGRLSEFCRDVCCDILGAAGRTAFPRDMDTLSAFARHAMEAGQRTGIVLTRQPERTFVETVREVARPFLLVLDDPRRSVLHRVETGTSPRDAIIEVGTSCACLTDVLTLPQAVRVTHELIAADLDAFARSLLTVMELPVEDAGLLAAAGEAIRRHLPRIVTDPLEPDIAERLETVLGSGWGLAAKAALGGYWTLFFEGKLGRLIAARDLFVFGAETQVSENGLIDATGRPRILSFGPYLRLPRGQWIMRMILAFSPELVGTPFTVDVTRYDGRVGVELGRISFTAISGRYVAQTTFAHDEPSIGLEFRLMVDKATFDGKVALGFVELERIEDQEAPDLGQLIGWGETA